MENILGKIQRISNEFYENPDNEERELIIELTIAEARELTFNTAFMQAYSEKIHQVFNYPYLFTYIFPFHGAFLRIKSPKREIVSQLKDTAQAPDSCFAGDTAR